MAIDVYRGSVATCLRVMDTEFPHVSLNSISNIGIFLAFESNPLKIPDGIRSESREIQRRRISMFASDGRLLIPHPRINGIFCFTANGLIGGFG